MRGTGTAPSAHDGRESPAVGRGVRNHPPKLLMKPFDMAVRTPLNKPTMPSSLYNSARQRKNEVRRFCRNSACMRTCVFLTCRHVRADAGHQPTSPETGGTGVVFCSTACLDRWRMGRATTHRVERGHRHKSSTSRSGCLRRHSRHDGRQDLESSAPHAIISRHRSLRFGRKRPWV